MATTTKLTISAEHEAQRSQPAPLTPVLSARYALRPAHAALCLLMVLVFLVLSYSTLATSELWRHVAAGEWILNHNALPTQSLHMPLAEGVPTLDTAWLPQVLLALVHGFGGAAALSALFVAASFGAVLMLAFVFYRQTGRKRFLATGTVLTLLLGWGMISQLRPETFGFLCLAGLLALLVFGSRWQSVPAIESAAEPTEVAAISVPWSLWIGAPLLLAIWANLGPSFVVGLLVLLAWSLGTAVDEARRSGIVQAIQSPACQHRVYVLNLAILATLLNPLGIDLWLATLGIASASLGATTNSVVPLVFGSLPGFALGIACLLAAVLLRYSPRSVSTAEVLIFLLGVAASAYNLRWMPWFAPLAALVLLPHLAAVLGVGRAVAAEPATEPEVNEAEPAKSFQFAFTLICVLLVWIGFALSPLATPILGGKPRPLAAWHGSNTPLGVAAWLETRETQPRLVWTSQEWADYLAYRAGVPVFAGSNASALPAQVQFDYLQLAAGENWQRVADRYAVDLLVIEKAQQPRMLASARRAEGPWRTVYEDAQALVIQRVPAASPQVATPADESPVEAPQAAAAIRGGRAS